MNTITNTKGELTQAAQPINDPYHNTPEAIAWRLACAQAIIKSSETTQIPHASSAPGWNIGD